MNKLKTITFGHSPDADDAFMFYGLAKEIVKIEGYEIDHKMADIQTLNELAVNGELPVTAISAAHYPNVSDHYRIMSCGASIGRNYGPVIVSKDSITMSKLSGRTVAIPGSHTTSWLLYQIFCPTDITPIFVEFNQIEKLVSSGKVDAGILLHEGQILYKNWGLKLVLDLGKHWFAQTGLPIPLGLDVVNRNLGQDLSLKVTNSLKLSIEYAHSNEDKALEYALGFGRGIEKEDGRKFVRMYVNTDTVNMGLEGILALKRLFSMAVDKGIIKTVPPLDIVQV